MDKLAKMKFMAITDRRLCKTRDYTSALKFLLSSFPKGVIGVQLREQDLTGRDFFTLTLAFRDVTAEYEAPLFIYERADMAMAAGADGIVLSESSLPVTEIRKLMPDALIGMSTHSFSNAKKAVEEGCNFITLGPIFETPARRDCGAPLGVETITTAAAKLTVPVYAVGGIDEKNAPEVMQAGASGIAACRLFFQGGQQKVQKRLSSLLELLEQNQ